MECEYTKDVMTTAEQLLAWVGSEPNRVLEEGSEYLDQLETGQPAERVGTLRAMGLAARSLGLLDRAIELGERSVQVASEAGLAEEAALGRLSLSGSLASSGRTERALEIIGDALTDPFNKAMEARFRFQRAAVLAYLGDAEAAVPELRSVAPVFDELGDATALAFALNQLGRNLTTLGQLEEASRHLERARDLFSSVGDEEGAAGVEHNLGEVAAYRGDIPLALRWMEASDERFMRFSGSEAPQHVSRCEVLISAGLFNEAAELASRIAGANRAKGDVEHEFDAVVVAASASLLGNDPEQAIAHTDRARELWADPSSARAAETRRLASSARYQLEGASRELLDEVRSTARLLSRSGQLVAAGQANLLAARIASDLGQKSVADKLYGEVAGVSAGPIEMRVQARLARALRAVLRNDPRAAGAAALSGLRIIEEHQLSVGASDLRLGLERHGSGLGEVGLGLAVESGRPRRILDWMERTRATSLTLRPVVPPKDETMTEALQSLRMVEARMRETPDPKLERDRRRLQSEVARLDRLKTGSTLRADRVSADRLVELIGAQHLLEMGVHDQRLVCVSVRDHRARRIDLGPISTIEDEVRQVRFGMRVAARRGRSFQPEGLARLDELLLGRVELKDSRVVVVPPPRLMAVPWSALSRFRGRQVVVAPSASIWAQRSSQTSRKTPVVVAGGPDLDMAEEEVRRVNDVYGTPVVAASNVSVAEATTALDSAGIAHIACHATFRAENPMFSSLRLGDGDLNVYDIERLKEPPSTVVLSACDSGYTEARSGEELAGLTSALLAMGTRSIVASVGLVPDSVATTELMVQLHRRLAEGIEPVEALAKAQSWAFEDPERFVAAASFICVGA